MDDIGPRTPASFKLLDVSRRFGERDVLRSVDIEGDAGSMTIICGLNGSGKTSLLRIIAGLLTPDHGQVTVCGREPGSRSTGYVPAGDRGLHWRLTGRQNLDFFARLAVVGNRQQAVESAAEALGARDLLDQRVGDCSTGQRRRLAVAQAIVGGPPILLLDEPYAELDEEGIDRVRDVVSTWRSRGGAVIAAAPSPDQTPTGADATIVRLALGGAA